MIKTQISVADNVYSAAQTTWEIRNNKKDAQRT